MLHISKLADYATLIMGFLSEEQPGKSYSAKYIAITLQMTQTTVSKLLKSLVKSGLILSERGMHGGYRLARSPDQITLTELIAAIDGKSGLTDCCIGKYCSKQTVCKTQTNWKLLHQAIYQALGQFTLHDIAKDLNQHALIKTLQKYYESTIQS